MKCSADFGSRSKRSSAPRDICCRSHNAFNSPCRPVCGQPSRRRTPCVLGGLQRSCVWPHPVGCCLYISSAEGLALAICFYGHARSNNRTITNAQKINLQPPLSIYVGGPVCTKNWAKDPVFGSGRPQGHVHGITPLTAVCGLGWPKIYLWHALLTNSSRMYKKNRGPKNAPIGNELQLVDVHGPCAIKTRRGMCRLRPSALAAFVPVGSLRPLFGMRFGLTPHQQFTKTALFFCRNKRL